MTPKKDKKKQPAKQKTVSKKKVAVKKKAKTKPLSKKAAPKKKASRKKGSVREKRQVLETAAFEPAGMGARSGGQSGSLQGLSDVAGADSESVDELIEEGNAFEAEVVDGIENVPDADEGEVTTHEVLEDDVPEEYLDNEE
jgi:hypothetical protein